MPDRFTGKIALVTGAGGGLGRCIALALAAEGARVVVAGRTARTLQETVARIEAAGGTGSAVTADVTRSADVEALVHRAVETFGSLDVAVNNAGILSARGPVDTVEESDWESMLRTNVTGVWLAMKHEIPQMRAQGGGSIVNIASNLGAHLRAPGMAAYVASKAAVSALTRAAARDHIAEGIRINAVSPGASDSAMSLRPGESAADRAVRMRTASPLGRVSSGAEIAAAVLYLASDAAASVVGTDLVVDGGTSA